MNIRISMQIKALSLRQPWASLVATGKKTIETRKRTTTYRGDILICASSTVKTPPYGCALAIAELYDIEPMQTKHQKAACIDVYPGAYAWHLRNIRKLKNTFPVKGMLGLFMIEIPDDIA